MRRFKWFSFTQYDEEMQYLHEQHEKGYKLVRFKFPGFYYFEKCPEEDVVYEIDFREVKNADKEYYLQLFRDSGWEYLFSVMNWHYFRKPAENEDVDLSIFSDVQSYVDMLSRMVKNRLLPLLSAFFLIIIPQIILNYLTWQDNGTRAIYSKAMLIVFVVLFVIYIVIFTYIGIGLYKLRDKCINGNK